MKLLAILIFFIFLTVSCGKDSSDTDADTDLNESQTIIDDDIYSSTDESINDTIITDNDILLNETADETEDSQNIESDDTDSETESETEAPEPDDTEIAEDVDVETLHICDNGEIRYIACGPNMDMEQRQVCADNKWGDSGDCVYPGAVCTEGETHNVECGMNSDEEQTVTCEKGKWATGECAAKPCNDGEMKELACGIDLTGVQKKVCVSGSWQDYGGCFIKENYDGLIVLTRKISKNQVGLPVIIEDYTHYNMGSYALIKSYKKQILFKWQGGDWLTVSYYELDENNNMLKMTDVDTGDILIVDQFKTGNYEIKSWEEYEWNGKGAVIDSTGKLTKKNLLKLIKRDNRGAIIYSERHYYDTDGKEIKVVTGYVDDASKAPDNQYYFASGTFIYSVKEYDSNGYITREGVQDTYGNWLWYRTYSAPYRLSADYRNVKINGVLVFWWKEFGYSANGHELSLIQKDISGNEVYSRQKTYDTSLRLVSEECTSTKASSEPCMNYRGAPLDNYSKSWTYNTSGYESAYLYSANSGALILEERVYDNGRIKSYYNDTERKFCSRRFNVWEDRAYTWDCWSNDIQTNANGLIRMDIWDYDSKGRMIRHTGSTDHAALLPYYEETYTITDDSQGSPIKISYTNSWEYSPGDGMEQTLTYNADNWINEVMHKISGGAPSFIYNYDYRKSYSGGKLASFDIKEKSESGIVQSHYLLEFNMISQMTKRTDYYTTGKTYIAREYFLGILRGGKPITYTASLYDTDGSTLLESYTMHDNSKLSLSFCTGSACMARILGLEVAKTYKLSGIQQDYWNESWEYDSMNFSTLTKHTINSGVYDGVTLKKTEPAYYEEYLISGGIPYLTKLLKDYPDCYITPYLWDSSSDSWLSRNAFYYLDEHIYDAGTNETDYAKSVKYSGSSEHVMEKMTGNADGDPSEYFCDYKNCNSDSQECADDLKKNDIEKDPDSPCHYISEFWTYDSGYITEHARSDRNGKVWEETMITYQKTGSYTRQKIFIKRQENIIVEQMEYNSDGKLIYEYKDNKYRENDINGTSYKNKKYYYDDEKNLYREEWLNRQNEIVSFFNYSHTYSEDIIPGKKMIVNTVIRNTDGISIGSYDYIYGPAQ